MIEEPSNHEHVRILEDAQVFDLDGALAAIREYASFFEPWHARVALLWAAQVPLAEVLPRHLVHIAFSGPKSSGKSEAVQLVTAIAGGRYLAGGTQAAFIRAFNEYPAVGIDEVDANIRKNPDLEAMLRSASDPDSVYQTSIPGKEKGRWESLDVRVGVPVAFAYRSQIEDALLSRTINIEMPRRDDPALVLRSIIGGNPPRHAIGDWLASAAAKRLKKWTASRVDAHMREPEFLERLKALPAVLGRQRQIGAVFLVISDVMGWDLEVAIQEAVQAKQEEEESYEDTKEVLVQLYDAETAHRGERAAVGVSVAIAAINEQRKADGLQGINYRTFARIRREFGFQDGVNVKKIRAKGGKRFLIYDKPVREALGLDDRSVPSPSSVRVPLTHREISGYE